MRFTVTYPMVAGPYDPALVTRHGLRRFALAAEAAGFDGIGFTDHPAPTHRWIEAGGHDALDPFAALSFVAAVTERLRLIPNIVVLPYRNPFLVAKAVATVDALSDGRFTLSVGTGYLRGEYEALGVPLDERNERFDQAIEVLRGVWSTDDFAYVGRGVTAEGQTVRPRPVQDPVPIWIGGNSGRSRQRVADVAQGWAPFPAPAGLARTTRTPPLETVDDLSILLDDLWRRVDGAGRDRAEIDVAWGCPLGGSPASDSFDADAHQEGLAELAGIGVSWVPVGIPGDDLARAEETLARYGDLVIDPHRRRARIRTGG
jgi:probable F420-dependent oxidoreductase